MITEKKYVVKMINACRIMAAMEREDSKQFKKSKIGEKVKRSNNIKYDQQI